MRTFLSLVTTPLIIFGITSIDLYLKNKTDLDSNPVVLLPFGLVFLAVVVFGYFVRKSKNLLTAYYVFGPAYLFYSFFKQFTKDPFFEILIFPGLFLTFFLFIVKKNRMDRLINFFAIFSLVLIAGQLFTVVDTLGIFKTNKTEKSVKYDFEKKDGRMPNIYHIVFDEYQTEMFEDTLTPLVEKELGGFIFYPENATVYGRTAMSLASVFGGVSYDYKTTQISYHKKALNSKQSLLYQLKNSGYETSAYIHKVYSFDIDLFDSFTEHKNNSSVQFDNSVYTKMFFNIWVYGYMPKILSEKIVAEDFIQQIKTRNVIADSGPVRSLKSFKNIIEDEKNQSDKNRYVFIHLILPHFPYLLDKDCRYRIDKKTSVTEQSKCATKLLTDFIDELKRLGRFEDSLIIVQADHGRFLTDGQIKRNDDIYYSEDWARARSRPLLLIKTPQRKSSDIFSKSTAPTTLLDIYPTVIDSLEIETYVKLEGFSLKDFRVIPDRVRYYHFFDKLDGSERTDEMKRYIITDKGVKFEKKIPLKF